MSRGINAVKGVIRIAIRILIDNLHRLTLHIFDVLFGFLNWPKKRLRIKVFILRTEDPSSTPAVSTVEDMIQYATRSFSKNFNVELLPVRRNGDYAEILAADPPRDALYTIGGPGALKEELKTAGNFFAANLSGAIYPVTVFVVRDIKGADGCSLGPMSDYVTIDHVGLKNVSVLAHELAHACGLWHIKHKENLLFTNRTRGDKVKWWQKNVFRSSRHITYW
jgi:hypothetical protein